jgi:hypothetical protein
MSIFAIFVRHMRAARAGRRSGEQFNVLEWLCGHAMRQHQSSQAGLRTAAGTSMAQLTKMVTNLWQARLWAKFRAARVSKRPGALLTRDGWLDAPSRFFGDGCHADSMRHCMKAAEMRKAGHGRQPELWIH